MMPQNRAAPAIGARTAALISILAHEAQQRLRQRYLGALCRLHLPLPQPAGFAAEAGYEGATLLVRAVLHGFALVPQSDDGSTGGYYSAERAVSVALGHWTMEQAARRLTAARMAKAWRRVDQEHGVRGSDLWRVDLHDNTGAIAASADARAGRVLDWRAAEPMDAGEQERLLAEAAAHDAQASYEAGMCDNFCTAAGLRRQAEALRRRVSIARSAQRLVA